MDSDNPDQPAPHSDRCLRSPKTKRAAMNSPLVSYHPGEMRSCAYFLRIDVCVVPFSCALLPRVLSMPDPAVEDPRVALEVPSLSWLLWFRAVEPPTPLRCALLDEADQRLPLPAVLEVPADAAPALPICALPVRAEVVPAKLPEDVSDLFPALAPIALPDSSWLAAAAWLPLRWMVAFSAAFMEVPELTCAPAFPPETEVLSDAAALLCEAAEVCARAVPTMRLPKTNEARMILIRIILLQKARACAPAEWQLSIRNHE
jgi:hypothetical protein